MLASTVLRMSAAASSPYFSRHSASYWASDLIFFYYCQTFFFSFLFFFLILYFSVVICGCTHRFLSLQPSRLDRIVVKSPPFLKRIPRKLVVILIVPVQHPGVIIQSHTTAKRLDGRRRLLQHVIRIDHTDLCARLTPRPDASDHRLGGVIVVVDVVVLVRGHVGTDKPDIPQVVKGTTDLVVPGLGRVIVIEPGDIVQRGDGAPVVRRDTEMGVADEEGKMETRPDLRGHHGGITRFGLRVVRVRVFLLVLLFLNRGGTGFHLKADRGSSKEINAAVGLEVAITVGIRSVHHPILAFFLLRVVAVDDFCVNGRAVPVDHTLRAYAAFEPSQRRGNADGLLVGREEVVDDVFDEDSLALWRR